MLIPNEFRDAMKQFSLFALNEIKRYIETGARVPITTHEVAVLVSPRVWSKKDVQVTRWSNLIYPREKQLKESTQYIECARQMTALSTIAQHLDQIVSFACWGTKYSIKNILFSFIERFLQHNGTNEFREASFSSVYGELESFFVSDQMEWEIWATLENCLCPEGPISLSNGLRIEPMPAELLENVFSFSQLDELIYLESVLHLELVIPKTIGTLLKSSEIPANAGARIIEDGLTSLRLSKPHRIWTNVLVVRPKRWVPLGSHPHYYNSTPHMRSSPSESEPEFKVTISDVASLSGRFRTLHSLNVGKFSALAVALRRFNQSYDRPLPEDRLIDQMISFEALYLADIGDDDRAEKKFRLALRSSYFLETGAKRKEVYLEMRSAYDVRSAIVHGGRVVPPSVAGVQMSVGDLANKTEEYLRRTLIRFLELSQQPGATKQLVRWDDLFFPDALSSS